MKTSLKTSKLPSKTPLKTRFHATSEVSSQAGLKSLMRFKTYGLWRPAAAALALLLGACASAPSVSEVQDDIPEQATQVLRAANQRTRTVASGEAATTMSGLGGTESTDLSARFASDPVANEVLDRVRAWLRDRVFTTEHFETTEGATAIFLLTPAVCSDGRLPAAPPCTTFFEENDVRLGVERGPNLGYLVSIMLGESRAHPFTFEVSEQHLAVRTHLGAIHEAARELGPEGAQLAASLPKILSGDVRVALNKGAEGLFGYAFDVEEVVVQTDPNSADNIAFSTGTSSLLNVTLNTATNAIEIKYDLPKTRLELPYQRIAPEGIAGSRFSVNVAGASATLNGADGQPIALTNVSLGGGKAEVKLDAFTLLSADINDGGRASFLAERRADGVTDLSVSPGLDLLLDFALAPIAGDVEVPDALLEAAYRFAFTADNGTPLMRIFEANWGTGESGYVQVINGTLTFAHVGNAHVAAEAGQCVSSATPAEGEDPILASFEVTDCALP